MSDFLSFHLPEDFIEPYTTQKVDWGFKDAAGNSVGEITFLRTYSRIKEDGTKEKWWEVCRRVIEGMFSIQKDHCKSNRLPWNDRKAQATAQDAFNRLFSFKWTPPGRGLWMMGTPLVNEKKNSAALQNCFASETEYITTDGIKTLGETVGTTQRVLSRGGKWVDAEIKSFGVQPLMKVTFSRNGLKKIVFATPEHRWFVKDKRSSGRISNVWREEFTEGLTSNHRVQESYGQGIKGITISPIGVMHGFTYGDGRTSIGERNSNSVTLFGEKDKALATYFEGHPSRPDRGGIEFGALPNYFKQIPDHENKSYYAGFLAGYFAADGSVDINGFATITSYNLSDLNRVRSIAASIGIGTGVIRSDTRISNLTGREHTVYSMSLAAETLTEEFFVIEEHCNRFVNRSVNKRGYWNVESVEYTDRLEKVYCAIVPQEAAFTLADNILTGNCCFVSTADMTKNDPGEPFAFLMEASMLGIGVGFDTKGSEKDFSIHQPNHNIKDFFIVEDTRESWAESTRVLINAYLTPNKNLPVFDYSQVRPAGSPIHTFGGTAAGPDPLIKLHNTLSKIFDERIGQKVTSRVIADIGNLIGVCVVSGNVRRSAELLLGSVNDEEFLSLKDYNGVGAERAEWSWMSNNSVSVNVGDDLSPVISGIAQNGEPGVVWLDISRQYGRLVDPPNNKDHRLSGYNPCAEQGLESWEMCVSGDTFIQTKTGLRRIADTVGESIEIWNGKKWAQVQPFYTGQNSLYRVTLSDGSYLDATPNHEWSIRNSNGSGYSKFKTSELSIGMVLPEFSLQYADGKPAEHAYTYGWIAGDGYVDGTKVMAIVKSDEYSALPHIGGTKYKEQNFNNNSAIKFSRVNVSGLVPLESARTMRYNDSLPDEVFGWDNVAISDFIGGWIDTDGSVVRQQNTDHYVLYGSEGKLRQAQLLLRRIGIDHSTLHLFAKKDQVTNKGIRNRDLYRLLIPSFESSLINTRIKVAKNFGSREGKNNAHIGSIIDRARKQKIVSIELISNNADTYCFNEPEEHMGVFGNVLTYQCTLVECFLNRHESLEDFKKTLKVAYLYGKTVTLLPTHWARTNAIMQRNRRIGTSISGQANFADNKGMPELRKWQDQGYEEIQRLDRIYSEWLCIRESIKTTTVKPSGTVSILAGESPGVHWAPGGEYFNRAIRFAKDEQLVTLFRNAGYKVEDDVVNSDTTVVVYFPIHSFAKRSERDVTLFEKASMAALAQRYWSDNSVSVTLSFNPDTEAEHVGTVLSMYEGQLKTVSFLPMIPAGAYAQMPYTGITKEEYNDAELTLWPIDLEPIYAGATFDAEGEQFCTTDQCLLPIGK